MASFLHLLVQWNLCPMTLIPLLRNSNKAKPKSPMLRAIFPMTNWPKCFQRLRRWNIPLQLMAPWTWITWKWSQFLQSPTWPIGTSAAKISTVSSLPTSMLLFGNCIPTLCSLLMFRQTLNTSPKDVLLLVANPPIVDRVASTTATNSNRVGSPIPHLWARPLGWKQAWALSTHQDHTWPTLVKLDMTWPVRPNRWHPQAVMTPWKTQRVSQKRLPLCSIWCCLTRSSTCFVITILTAVPFAFVTMITETFGVEMRRHTCPISAEMMINLAFAASVPWWTGMWRTTRQKTLTFLTKECLSEIATLFSFF